MLETENLRLIPADPALAEQLAQYYRRNRSFLQPFEPLREEDFYTAAYQRVLLAQEVEAEKQRQGYRFYLRLKGRPDRLIGCIGLNQVVWGAFRSCFLGYKLDAEYEGQGFMTAAVALVVEYAFSQLQLHRLEANVMPRNKASLRVLEKNGFENEGLSRAYLYINGVWEDHLHMVKRNDSLTL